MRKGLSYHGRRNTVNNGASLAFNFLNGQGLDPSITFTRASTGTFFNSAGVLTSAAINAPRFDYDPATLAAQGLLIEEQRTNVLTYSEDFSDASWAKTEINVTTNSTTSPSGNSTADTLTPSTNNAGHFFQRLGIITGAGTYTDSIFVKANGYNFLVSTADTGGNATFNVSTGVVVSTSGGATASIQSVGNGWYRCSTTRTTTGAASLQYQIRENSGVFAYAGNGTSGIFLWGAQLEAGAFPTSYIPTTTTALTRSADVASVNTLSPWFNSTAGTVYAEASVPVAAAYSGYVYLLGTFNDGIHYYRQLDFQPVDRVRTGSVDQFINGFGAIWNTTGVFKNAQAYGTNDFAGVVNGGAVATDTSGTVPTVSVLNLGSTGAGATSFNGYLRRIVYYPRRLSNADLQTITA